MADSSRHQQPHNSNMNEVRVSQIPVDETGYDGDEEREARTEISATKRALKLVGAGTSRERQNPSTSMAGSSSDRNSDNQAFNSISDYVPRSPPRLMPFTDMVPSRPLRIGDPSLNGLQSKRKAPNPRPDRRIRERLSFKIHYLGADLNSGSHPRSDRGSPRSSI
jgi:hypothetical protein